MRRVALIAALAVLAGSATALTQNQRGTILGAYPHDPDAEAYFAKLQSRGWAPYFGFRRAVTSYIACKKGYGSWGKQDATYLTMVNSIVATTNLAQPALYVATVNGTCTFGPTTGFMGDGTTCYLDTVVLTSALTRLTQNNSEINACSAGQGANVVGAATSTGVVSSSPTANEATQVTSGTAVVDTGGGGSGCHFGWRTSSSTVTTGNNGVIASNAVANTSSALPAVSITIGRKNAGFFGAGTSIYLVEFGAPITSEAGEAVCNLQLIRAIGETRL